MSRRLLLGFSVVLLTATTALPAAAQVGDFFCSTFSLGCEPPPPPPAPALAPAPEVEQPAKKKVRHARKATAKRTAAKADKADADKGETAAK